MSLNCFRVSFSVSSSCTYTRESPGKLNERMPKSEGSGDLMKAFCAIVCSMGRVTSCSTSCCSAGPLRARHRYSDGNVRVLSLRHVVVTVPAPDEGAQQQDQRHLTMLSKEAGRIV